MGLVKAHLTVAVGLIQSLPLDPGRSGIASVHHPTNWENALSTLPVS